MTYSRRNVVTSYIQNKFGEEYSSVYYITIRVLLFYDNTKKMKRDMKKCSYLIHSK